MQKSHQNLKDSKSTQRKKNDEFSKLKMLALELKNMQLQLLKDMNKADYRKQNNAIKLN